MKQLIAITIILIAWIQMLQGQNFPDRLASFRSGVLPQYDTYFTSAELTQGNQLYLLASDDYMKLSEEGKKAIMDNLIKSWNESLVVVRYATRKELWGWNSEKGEALKSEAWDLNGKAVTSASPDESLSKISKHPWFFYVGSAAQLSSDKNLTGALNLRIGFFLLRDKWDFAGTFAEQFSGNIESEEMTTQTNAGLMSKFYLLKKKNISPFVGGEAAVSLPSGGKATFAPSGLGGVSLFMGNGCLDIGVRIGGRTSLMVGYTIIPNYRLKK